MPPPKRGTPEYDIWILTPEYKEFIKRDSDSNSGNKNPFFKKRHSDKTLKMLSEQKLGSKNPNFGKRLSHVDTMEWRSNHSDRMSGGGNPNWLGENYTREYSRTFDELFKKRNRIKYGNVCLFPGCGITPEENGRELDVHHYDYDKNSLNCVPLCRSHNDKANYNRYEWEEYFTWVVRMYLEWYGRGNWQSHIYAHKALY